VRSAASFEFDAAGISWGSLWTWVGMNVNRKAVAARNGNNKPRRGDSTTSVPCVGAFGGLLGLARGLPSYWRRARCSCCQQRIGGVISTPGVSRSSGRPRSGLSHLTKFSSYHLWITSFLVLARIVSTSRFRVKKKMKQKHK